MTLPSQHNRVQYNVIIDRKKINSFDKILITPVRID